MEVEDHFVGVFKGSIESLPTSPLPAQIPHDDGQSLPLDVDHRYAANCSPTLPRIGNL